VLFRSVRIRYAGNNNATGYAYGLDCRINGEFVPGAESWINFSFLKTREQLDGIQHKIRDAVFNNNTGKWEISDINVGNVPRPSDRAIGRAAGRERGEKRGGGGGGGGCGRGGEGGGRGGGAGRERGRGGGVGRGAVRGGVGGRGGWRVEEAGGGGAGGVGCTGRAGCGGQCGRRSSHATAWSIWQLAARRPQPKKRQVRSRITMSSRSRSGIA